MRKVEFLEDGNVKVTVPLRLNIIAGQTKIITAETKVEPSAIAIQIARAFRWQSYIDTGRFANATELSKSVGRNVSLVTRILRLTRLSPRIIHAALESELPTNVNYDTLVGVLPTLWSEQEAMLEFPKLDD